MNVVGLAGCIIISLYSVAQGPPSSISIGAYSQRHADIFAGFSVPASLAQLKSTQAGIYGERKFFLDDLNYVHAALGLVTPAGNFGLQLNYYGFNAYRQTGIGLAHARKLGTKLDIGVLFNYNTINLAAYGSASTISVGAGAILHITEKLHSGIHLNGGLDRLPVIITFGTGYEISNLFFICTEIIKEENKPIDVNVGMHYQVIPQLHIRAGIAASTSSVWIAAGFSWKQMRLDIINKVHPQLGVTPSLMLLFTFPQKNTNEKVVADDSL